MNVYSIFPLISIFSNSILCIYILYIDPKNRLNQFFSFFTASLALWSFTTYFNFNSISSSEAMIWNDIGTIGSILTSIFLFHFILIYSKNKLANNKIFLSFLYLVGIFLIFIEFTTNLITNSMYLSYWGFAEETGMLYILVIGYISLLVTISLIVSITLFLRTPSKEIKNQTFYLSLAIAIPLIGGIITQAIPPILNLEIIPLTSSLSTITAVIIVFSNFKYGFIMPISFSIRKKLVVMFFILILTLSASTLIVARFVTHDSMGEIFYDKLSSVAHSRADAINVYLDEHKIDVLHFSSDKIYTELLGTERSDINYDLIYNDSLYNINSHIKYDPHIDKITIVDNSGFTVISSEMDDICTDRSKFHEFIAGKEGLYVSDIFPCRKTGEPAVLISAPIENLGVIIVKFDVSELYHIISESIGFGETGEIYLVNKSGIMISPSRYYNESYNFENIIFKQKVETQNYYDCLLHSIYSEEELKIQHAEVKITTNYIGKKCLGTHVYLPEKSWALLAEIDEAEAYATVYNLQNILTLVIMIFSLIILLFAATYSKSISNPIVKLNEYAKQITNGNFDINFDIKTNDELESLSNSFYLMTQSLKDHTENLEYQVNERTVELKNKIDELERFKKVTVGRELKMNEMKKKMEKLRSKKNGVDNGID